MKILVIPDVHLKPEIFDEADRIPKDRYDNIVCLGDLVDDWGKQNDIDLYRTCLECVIRFGKDHPDMLFCYGNHDISYIYCLQESGFSFHAIQTVNNYLTQLKECVGKRLAVMHRIDDTLFSHAGLSDYYINGFLPDKYKDSDMDVQIEIINSFIKSDFTTKKYLWNDNSPIWLRPQKYTLNKYGEKIVDKEFVSHILFDPDRYFQVVGHTPTQKAYSTDCLLSVDTFSTYSNGKSIGDEKFVVVDTVTKEWEYA